MSLTGFLLLVLIVFLIIRIIYSMDFKLDFNTETNDVILWYTDLTDPLKRKFVTLWKKN